MRSSARFALTIMVVSLLALGLVGCDGNDDTEDVIPANAWAYEVQEHEVQDVPLPPIPVFVNDQQVGTGNLLVLHHRAGTEDAWPAVWCLYSSGYFRLTPATQPATSFGTSGMLGPAYWADGRYHHHPVLTEIRVSGNLQDGEALQVTATGTVGSFAVSYEITVHAATSEVTRCDVVQTATCTDGFSLDVARVNLHEGFKLAQFSSMYIDDHVHDADTARYVGTDGTRAASFAGIAAEGDASFLFDAPAPMAQPRFDFAHDAPPGWQGYTPTVSMTLADPDLTQSCTPQGWFNPTDDENDDNVGGWINWNAAPIDWQPGDTHAAEYEFAAHAVGPGGIE